MRGDFGNLSFTPDVAGIVQEALQDPEKLKKNIDNAKESIKDIKNAIKDPKAVGNLLNNLGR